MQVDTVIFDLDGTLIDSALSIKSSLKAAFADIGIEQKKPITTSLIGPPLMEIMLALVVESDIKAVPYLIESFKHYYDDIGYKETIAYEGVFETLINLNRNGLSLYIATNKRILPTKKIIHHLGWEELFVNVFSLDYFSPSLKNKTTMLRVINSMLPGKSVSRVYVGDRAEDAEASRKNDICFLWAKWGYSLISESIEGCKTLEKPDELIPILLNV
jgi:phosphoglycolate phosphatase